MSPKNLKLLFAAFALLALLAVLPTVVTLIMNAMPKKNASLFNGFNFDKVVQIDVQQGDKKVSLVKKQNAWSVDGNLASEPAVKNVLASLKNLQYDGLVSKNKANYAQYGVDDQNGYTLTVYSGSAKLSVVVGFPSDISNNFFMRKSADDGNVYLIIGDLRQQMNTDEASWRDKTIVSIAPDNIAKIELGGAQQATFDKTSSSWSAINGLFNPLAAFNFTTTDQKTSFTQASGKTTIQLFDASNNNLATLVALADGDNYYVQKLGSDEVFLVYGSMLDALLKPAR